MLAQLGVTWLSLITLLCLNFLYSHWFWVIQTSNILQPMNQAINNLDDLQQLITWVTYHMYGQRGAKLLTTHQFQPLCLESHPTSWGGGEQWVLTYPQSQQFLYLSTEMWFLVVSNSQERLPCEIPLTKEWGMLFVSVPKGVMWSLVLVWWVPLKTRKWHIIDHDKQSFSFFIKKSSSDSDESQASKSALRLSMICDPRDE